MKRFSAQYIITNSGPPLKRAIITTEDNGTIQNIEITGGNLEEKHSIEFYNGIIIPGFVNCHSHLELSHILEKLKTLQSYFPSVSVEELIRWATVNGAKASGEEDRFGKIEIGRKPGLLLIQNIDLQNMRLMPDSFVTRLI